MGQPCLEIRNLSHSYDGQLVLKIDRLNVAQGEVLVLLGPNGAGKSTLLRILDFLEFPDEGGVFFKGEQVRKSSNLLQLRRRMAMVFQDPLLFNTTVIANVAYGLRARRIPILEAKERAVQALELLGISHLSDRPARNISGGEAQRVALARALAVEPEVLLLDEPLASLDAPTREFLKEDMQRLFKELALSVVYVTHDQTEAVFMADRTAIMDRGRILQVGSVQEVFSAPASEEVASFVGVETILLGEIESNSKGVARIRINGEEVEALSDLPVGREVLVCIRPEEVTVMKDERIHSSARNHFEALVTKLLDYGAQVKITLDCGFPLVALITKKSVDELKIRPGQRLVASFKATGVHVIPK